MKRISDVALGAITLGIAAALVASVSWVNQSGVRRDEKTVVAQFRDVGNTRVGNSVVIRGVIGGRRARLSRGSRRQDYPPGQPPGAPPESQPRGG